jgi:hypothetical protein
MKNKKWIFFVAPPGVVLFIALFGYLIKFLWNWLAPALFTGAHLITYWQALGILLLCRILFGSWGGGNRGDRQRRYREAWEVNRKQWEAMTPEEQEKYRKGWGTRCGNFTPPAAEPTNPF